MWNPRLLLTLVCVLSWSLTACDKGEVDPSTVLPVPIPVEALPGGGGGGPGGRVMAGAQIQQCQAQMISIAHDVDIHYAMNQRLPRSLQDMGLTGAQLTDPWGYTFRYQPTNERRFELFSVGPDGQAMTGDDRRF